MNDANLIPLNKRPMSEQREIQQKGGGLKGEAGGTEEVERRAVASA